MRRYAFEGIHLLDFTWYGVGPITTKYLADNGADVIRIESSARLDGLRHAPPWKDAKPGGNNRQYFKEGHHARHEQAQGARDFSPDAPVGRCRDRELHTEGAAQMGPRL